MNPIIELTNVDLTVNSKPIIHHFSARIMPGDFIVVLGGNGSGKSTLLKLLNRTYRRTSGDILFQQKSIDAYDAKTMKAKVATITQFIADSIFVDLTVEENAQLIESEKISSKALSDYLFQFNPALAHALKTKVKNLSGGEQQILAFALYLRHQPDLLLLDEHTSALDPKKADQVMAFTNDFIQKHQITCLMTTHQLDYAIKYGNRLMAIRDGKLVFEANKAEKSQLGMSDLLKYCY